MLTTPAMYYNPANNLKYSIIVLLLFTFSKLLQAQTPAHFPKVTSDSLFKIESNGLKILIDPKVSGRVISFKLDGKELLTGPDREVFNYGATFWPSPQLDWGWPPRPALDGHPYKVKIRGNEVVLTSDKDSLLGYQITKRFKAIPEDTAILAIYNIKNLSMVDRKVAGWEIHRVSTGGLSFFPSGAEKAAPQSNLQVKEIKGIIWYKSDPANLAESSNKLFMHGKEGWLGHVHKDLLFIKRFEDISEAKVPIKEEEVEIYVNSKKGYIELENQGPFTTLKPGESLNYEVKWYLRKLPATIKAVEGNEKLIEFVRKVLN
jgi:hypothetical protein